MKIRQKAKVQRAFTVIELAAIVAVLAVMAGLLLNNMARPRAHGCRIKCINNLKNVGLAFRIFATDNDDRFPFELSVTNGGTRELHALGDPFHTYRALSNELSTPKIILCPSDHRSEATNWINLSNFNSSYFLNTNAVEATPNAVLAGDRNIRFKGNRIPPGRFNLPAGASFSFDARLHTNQGNICFADGSVSQFSNAQMGARINHSGSTLAIP